MLYRPSEVTANRSVTPTDYPKMMAFAPDMRLYFDACCLNRLTDDHGQERIRKEAEAIETLMGVATRDANVWVGSAALEAEIARNPNSERREDAQALLTFVKQTIRLDDTIVQRARGLRSRGFSAFDAMHLDYELKLDRYRAISRL